MKHIEIILKPFNQVIDVYVLPTLEESYADVESKVDDHDDHYGTEGCKALTLTRTIEGKPYWFILLRDNYNDSTLIHELLHTILSITRYVDFPISKKTEEYFAYVMGDTFEQIKELLSED